MQQVSLTDAEHFLPKLIRDVQNGEEIIITENEKPVAKIVSILSENQPLKKISAGSAKGMIKISDDFDDPLDDFKEYMQ